ncbi:MAG: DUF116 domain-containing protein [Bacillus sp. (in: Bacteria)]|nr:DUF116 domain-containing protein [Bacillus sp. (in: firmicutes)]
MKGLTYLLDDEDGYYNDVKEFTANFLLEMNKRDWNELSNFISFDNQEKLDRNYYYLEVLMIGVFWKVYIHHALAMNEQAGQALVKLNRSKNDLKWKYSVDRLRGVMGTLFLRREKELELEFTKENFRKLLDYLLATGEFDEEVKRFETWHSFFHSKSKDEVAEFLFKTYELALNFEKNSKKVLGKYTRYVERFMEENEGEYRWKENIFFCLRQRIEYHLNMLGAEIMNCTFRKAFLQSETKQVFLPVCMRYKSIHECMAKKSEYNSLHCQGCSSACKVNEIVHLGKEMDFEVTVIPHESSLQKSMEKDFSNVGVIGIACVLQLISGGLKVYRFGLNPQCVLLNYSGCSNHWSKSGIVTNFSRKKLKEIVVGTSQLKELSNI